MHHLALWDFAGDFYALVVQVYIIIEGSIRRLMTMHGLL